MKQEIKELDLQQIEGGVISPILAGGVLVSVPFVFGAIAGAADEFARKHGHS